MRIQPTSTARRAKPKDWVGQWGQCHLLLPILATNDYIPLRIILVLLLLGFFIIIKVSPGDFDDGRRAQRGWRCKTKSFLINCQAHLLNFKETSGFEPQTWHHDIILLFEAHLNPTRCRAHTPTTTDGRKQMLNSNVLLCRFSGRNPAVESTADFNLSWALSQWITVISELW